MNVFKGASEDEGPVAMTLANGDWISGLKRVASWWTVLRVRGQAVVLLPGRDHRWIWKRWGAGLETKSIG